MKNYVRGLWGIVGIGLLTIPVARTAGASDTSVTSDTVIRETPEAVTAKTAAAMENFRDSLTQTLSRLPSR